MGLSIGSVISSSHRIGTAKQDAIRESTSSRTQVAPTLSHSQHFTRESYRMEPTNLLRQQTLLPRAYLPNNGQLWTCPLCGQPYMLEEIPFWKHPYIPPSGTVTCRALNSMVSNPSAHRAQEKPVAATDSGLRIVPLSTRPRCRGFEDIPLFGFSGLWKRTAYASQRSLFHVAMDQRSPVTGRDGCKLRGR